MAIDDVVDRVARRRRRLGLSQAAVATACGMTQGHYSKLERGCELPGSRARQALGAWLEGKALPLHADPKELVRVAAALEAQAKALRRLAGAEVGPVSQICNE